MTRIEQYNLSPFTHLFMEREPIMLLSEYRYAAVGDTLTNKQFLADCHKKLETVRISGRVYVINDDIFNPDIVRILGAKIRKWRTFPLALIKTFIRQDSRRLLLMP